MEIQTNPKMDRYLIETPHTDQDCQALIDQVHAMGYLHHFDWGCISGVHSGWAIIEAESEDQARLAVPSFVRRNARVVKLNRFDGSTIWQHKKVEVDQSR